MLSKTESFTIGVEAAADRQGKYLPAAGTHPFSHWKRQRITPKERYQGLCER